MACLLNSSFLGLVFDAPCWIIFLIRLFSSHTSGRSRCLPDCSHCRSLKTNSGPISYTTFPPNCSIAAALHNCSYWFLMGMVRSFFLRYIDSEVVSKPVAETLPSHDSMLSKKLSLPKGRIQTFSSQ